MHDIVGVSITVATILAATIFSNQSVNSLRTELRSEVGSLRSEMHAIRTELLGKLEAIQKDMREFYAEQARHDIRIANLEQQHKS
jgi:predicted  nucleic acid-binding Zn-ribbon protein